MKYKLFYVSLFFGCLACSGSKDNDISKVKLKELTGQSIDLAQFEGKAVFINFWATWCKPCIQEMPTIAAAQEQLKNENVIFLIASNEEPEQIEKFIKKHSYNFHYVHLENMEALKIQALPTTFIFNPEGKMKFSENGFRTWDEPANIELITKIVNDHEK
jgi:thiol-disulfide isomerase/thioredoxin